MADSINLVEFMDTLIEGGFNDEQAKTLTSAMFQLTDIHLVTKGYLDTRLAQLKSELIQWMVTIMIVQTGATAVLFKLMH